MSSRRRRSAIEHARGEQRRDEQRRLEQQIEDLIKRCSRAIERGTREDCFYVARKLRGELIPLVDEYTDRSFHEYDSDLDGSPIWHWVAFSEFLDAGDAYVRRLESGRRDGVRTLRFQTGGISDEDTSARTIVELTLESITAIAEHEDIVMADYATRVEVRGLSCKLGDHLQDEELDIGDPVYGVTLQSGGLKTLHGGPTGSAKSAGLERDVEDLYGYDPDDQPELEFLPTQRFKILDLVDLERGESWFYDVPQQDPDLRKIREEHDLPPSFAEADEDRDRQIEIFAPLTRSLVEHELPYDTDAERFTVRPFVIPASDIPKSLLVSTITTRLSKGQTQTIQQAYDEVDRERGDWSLANLAETIRGRGDLSDKHKSDAIGVLRSLQSESFIRTGQDDRTIDWADVFEDVDTVTVFSQATSLVESRFGQMFVIAYLLDKILRARSGEGFYGLPPAVLVARELWRVVPHARREVSDDRIAEVQSFIGDTMTRALRQNRDYNAHLVADTQKPYDLVNSVREMFNRYVIYSGTSKLVEGVFDWTSNEKSSVFARTLTAARGQGGIVGEVQPAIDRRWIEFLSPVEWVPPSHHHFSKTREQSGWISRAEYLDREELRAPSWDCTIPDHLSISTYSTDGPEVEIDDDPEPKELHRAEARSRRERGESYRSIAENLPDNPSTGNSYSHTTIRDWVADVEKGSRLGDDD